MQNIENTKKDSKDNLKHAENFILDDFILIKPNNLHTDSIKTSSQPSLKDKFSLKTQNSYLSENTNFLNEYIEVGNFLYENYQNIINEQENNPEESIQSQNRKEISLSSLASFTRLNEIRCTPEENIDTPKKSIESKKKEEVLLSKLQSFTRSKKLKKIAKKIETECDHDSKNINNPEKSLEIKKSGKIEISQLLNVKSSKKPKKITKKSQTEIKHKPEECPNEKFFIYSEKKPRIDSNYYASKPCYFCNKLGHYRDNCPDLAEAQKNRQIVCYNCNGFGHYYTQCPLKNNRDENYASYTCYNCNQKGHIKNNCPLRKLNQPSSILSDSNSEKEQPLFDQKLSFVEKDTKKCNYCKKNGHWVRDCPQNTKDLSISIKTLEQDMCYLCKEKGHVQNRCPRDDQKICYICKHAGHFSHDCPKKNKKDVKKSNKCYNCGEAGHYKYRCPKNKLLRN